MALKLRMGLAAWSNSHFDNALFHPGTRHDQYLPRYASLFDCAEADILHHQYPKRELLDAWVAGTPEGFTFLPKMHKHATHEGETQAAVRWLRGIQPLRDAGRLGPVLLQFPPSLDRETGWDQVTDLLRTAAPGTFAVEVRHNSWFTPAFEALLEDHEALLVWSTYPGAFTPPWVLGERGYIRFTGKHGPRRGRHVTVDARPREVQEIRKRLEGVSWREAYCIVTNPFEGNAVDSLATVAAGLGLEDMVRRMHREPGRPLLADPPAAGHGPRPRPPPASRPSRSPQSRLTPPSAPRRRAR